MGIDIVSTVITGTCAIRRSAWRTHITSTCMVRGAGIRRCRMVITWTTCMTGTYTPNTTTTGTNTRNPTGLLVAILYLQGESF